MARNAAPLYGKYIGRITLSRGAPRRRTVLIEASCARGTTKIASGPAVRRFPLNLESVRGERLPPIRYALMSGSSGMPNDPLPTRTIRRLPVLEGELNKLRRTLLEAGHRRAQRRHDASPAAGLRIESRRQRSHRPAAMHDHRSVSVRNFALICWRCSHRSAWFADLIDCEHVHMDAKFRQQGAEGADSYCSGGLFNTSRLHHRKYAPNETPITILRS